MLDAAAAAGESHLDVSSNNLMKAVAGGAVGSAQPAMCRRLMLRMMIPGDYDLTAAAGPRRSALLIRFRLPR